MEEELPFLGEGREKQYQMILAQGGGPAFLGRAARCQEAWNSVLRQCRRQRDELLEMTILRLGQLYALAGEWSALRPWLSDEQLAHLRRLHDELQPRLRMPLEPTTSAKVLHRAILDLKESIDRFNDKWRDVLAKVDLTHVNLLRDKYNKYYVLEKECIVRSPILARHGFEPLQPATATDVEAELPLLPALELDRF